MAGVDPALDALGPVVLLQALADVAMLWRHQAPLQLGRHFRHVLPLAEIGPDHPAPFDDGVGLGLDLLAQRRVGRLGRHVHDVAVDVELPAMVDAAQTAFLVAPEPEIDATVRAVAVEQAEAAVGVLEGDQVLAQHPHAHRRAVGHGQLFRQQHRHPEAAHQVAHQRARTHAGQIFIVLFGEHERLFSDLRGRAARRSDGAGEASSPLHRGECLLHTVHDVNGAGLARTSALLRGFLAGLRTGKRRPRMARPPPRSASPAPDRQRSRRPGAGNFGGGWAAWRVR